jgi:putative membrane protein
MKTEKDESTTVPQPSNELSTDTAAARPKSGRPWKKVIAWTSVAAATCAIVASQALTWAHPSADTADENDTKTEQSPAANSAYALDHAKVASSKTESGHVTMRFDYTNKTRSASTVDGKSVDTVTPFVCATVFQLDNDKFSHVKVTNGRVLDAAGRTVAAGYALPGVADSLGLKSAPDLPEHFEVSADVKDFSLGSTVTYATSSMFGNINEKKLYTMQTAMNVLVQGVANSADAGVAQPEAGLKQLSEQSSSLADMSSQMKQLYAALDKMPSADSMTEVQNDVATAAKDSSDAVAALKSIDTSKLSAADAAKVKQALDKTEASDAANKKAYDTLQKADPVNVAKQADQLKQTIGKMSSQSGSGSSDSSSIEGITKLHNGAKSLHTATTALAANLQKAGEGAKSLANGTGQLNTSAGKQVAGIEKLASDLHQFDKKAIGNLVNNLGGNLDAGSQHMKAMVRKAKAYNAFTGKSPHTDSSVTFSIQTAKIG